MDKAKTNIIISSSKISLFFIALGVFGFLILILPILSKNYDFKELGPMGDLIGGLLNPIIGIAAALLTFLAFYIQYQANLQVQRQFRLQKFESQFYEMIRLYRENVNEFKYQKYKNKNESKFTYENRHVLSIIFQEFIDCYRDVSKYSRGLNYDEILILQYREKLDTIVKKINPNIDLKELAIIDIAYTIVFYGLGEEGESVIRLNFKKKYSDSYFYKLLFFLKLKPKKENIKRFKKWKVLRKMELPKLYIIVKRLYDADKRNKGIELLSENELFYIRNKKYDKYYGGHQFRLGHYFRHLFQSFKFLNKQIFLSESQKYEYGKLYRAQLSNYEQALLLININSLSSLGMKWEYVPENGENFNYSNKLITKYNLIKNLPGEMMFGITYKTYYPAVSYETEK